MPCYTLTSIPGLEAIALRDIALHFQRLQLPLTQLVLSPGVHRGRLQLQSPADPDKLRDALFSLRSVFYIYQELAQWPCDEKTELSELQQQVQCLPLPALAQAKNFCVRARRQGQHRFRSDALEREIGAVVKQRFWLPVNLKKPDYLLFFEIEQKQVRVARQLNTTSLNQRMPKKFQPSVTLKPVLAYLMLAAAEIGSFQGKLRLLDPFCGAGTIPCEAAIAFPELELYASERHRDLLAGARRNADHLALSPSIQFQEMDARDLAQHWPAGYFHYIVTDPPLGKQLGHEVDFHRLYQAFLAQAAQILCPGGRLVLLTGGADRLFRNHLHSQGRFQQLYRQRIELGTHAPWLYVLEKN